MEFSLILCCGTNYIGCGQEIEKYDDLKSLSCWNDGTLEESYYENVRDFEQDYKNMHSECVKFSRYGDQIDNYDKLHSIISEKFDTVFGKITIQCTVDNEPIDIRLTNIEESWVINMFREHLIEDCIYYCYN